MLLGYGTNHSNAEATVVKKHKNATHGKHLNPVLLVFIGVHSDEYPCVRVLSQFLGFLHHFVLAKLCTRCIRLNDMKPHSGARGELACLTSQL